MIHLHAIPLRAEASASLPPGPAPLTSSPPTDMPPVIADAGTVIPNDGNARTHRKATNREIAERVNFVSELLARRIKKFHIKRLLRERYSVKARMAERYLARARELLCERAGQPRDIQIGELMAFYDRVIADPQTETRDKLAAAEAIRSMRGLDAPRRVAGPDGEAAAPALVNVNVLNLPVEMKRSLLAAAFAMRGLPGQVVDEQVIPVDAAGSDES